MSVASEINRLNVAKANLKLKLNAKNDEDHQITTETLDDYPDFVDSISGGGADVVNGIIEQYKAESETIDANTFVEFVNKYGITAGTETELNSRNYSGNYASSVALDENRVFITHSGDSSETLYGTVCTINGTTITAGIDTKIATTTGTSLYNSVCLLDENKVFVAHTESNMYLDGIVCTIEETTITVGTVTRIATGYNGYSAGEYVSVTTLNSNKVFIAHNNNYYTLYGIVCIIEGTAITKGADTQISTASASQQYASVITLDENKVFITHRNSTGNSYLNGVVCEINGTTITHGQDTVISYSQNSYYYVSVTKLNNNKVFIAYRWGSTSSIQVSGIVCKINGTSISTGSSKQLGYMSDNYNSISAVTLKKDKVFVTFTITNSGYLTGIICSIKDTTITIGTTIQLSTTSVSYISNDKLKNDKVFIAYRGGNDRLYGIVCNIENDTIKLATDNIEGITKAECTTSTAGDVWVLDN